MADNDIEDLTGEQAVRALDRIHLLMCFPYDWSGDTLDRIHDVMQTTGYRLLDEECARLLGLAGVTEWKVNDPRLTQVLEDYRPPSLLRKEG